MLGTEVLGFFRCLAAKVLNIVSLLKHLRFSKPTLVSFYRTMENPGYKCYYCPLYSDFDTVIKHSIVTHSGNTLKYRRPLIHLSSVHKCKLTGGGHLAAILVIGQSPYSYLGESLIKIIYV